MSITFTRTREQFARMVLRKMKVLASGGSDVSADMDIVYEALDLRLKEMHRRGTFWRKVEERGVGFAVGTVISASTTGDILFPIAMTLKDGSADEPVSIVGILEWNGISNKTETGTPTRALWNGGAEFLFHPIPTASASGTLIYQRITDDTSAGTAPDIEVSMLRWMKTSWPMTWRTIFIRTKRRSRGSRGKRRLRRDGSGSWGTSTRLCPR